MKFDRPNLLGMIENPFSLIDRRLNKIESILCEIKNSKTNVPPPKNRRFNHNKKKVNSASKFESEVSNG